jgi:hypothetical protein
MDKEMAFVDLSSTMQTVEATERKNERFLIWTYDAEYVTDRGRIPCVKLKLKDVFEHKIEQTSFTLASAAWLTDLC